MSMEIFTQKELSIIKILIEGEATKDVAKETNISIKTAEKHISNIIKKAGLKSVRKLIVAHYKGDLKEQFNLMYTPI